MPKSYDKLPSAYTMFWPSGASAIDGRTEAETPDSALALWDEPPQPQPPAGETPVGPKTIASLIAATAPSTSIVPDSRR
ncbi:unannotated protein [freshwater metagenome]|uniref:Unannotated protein n=1 Tax=freshwater metagenome TaxID=449393 RepID=A0A6J6P6M3_9ZZZZ